MKRLRFFRILLPASLLLLIGLFVYFYEPPPQVQSDQQSAPGDRGPRAEGVSFLESGSAQGTVKVVESGPDGVHMEEISKFSIEREGREPLIIESAKTGDRENDPERPSWHFEEVVMYDPERDFRVILDGVSIPENDGVARSVGTVRFEGAQWEGSASSLQYGLQGQSSRMEDPRFFDEEGRSVTAEEARLLDGLEDVELVGNVRVSTEEHDLQARRLRVERDEEENLRRVRAGGSVHGTLRSVEGRRAVRAENLDARFSSSGELARVELREEARIDWDEVSLSAAAIDNSRATPQEPWAVLASGSAHLVSSGPARDAELEAERLAAEVAADGAVLSASGSGEVAFRTGEVQGWAEEADYDPGRPLPFRLTAPAPRKARMARSTLRVAAQQIDSAAGSGELRAKREVEASILPSEGGEDSILDTGFFAVDEAVHFVSDTLDLQGGAGGTMLFRGSVRGWQGESNLRADEVAVDQSAGLLEARGDVTTRMPRPNLSPADRESGFLAVDSASLLYKTAERHGHYEGGVRILVREGWLEAEALDVWLEEDRRALRRVEAVGAVRAELTDAAGNLIEAEADRAVFLPGDSEIRWIGEAGPAIVRRRIGGQDTTAARELVYHLERGTLDVAGGARGPASILSDRPDGS